MKMAWGARHLISTRVVTSTGATGAATREPFVSMAVSPLRTAKPLFSAGDKRGRRALPRRTDDE